MYQKLFLACAVDLAAHLECHTNYTASSELKPLCMECNHPFALDKWHNLFLNQLLITFQTSYTSSAKLTGEPRGFFSFGLMISNSCYCFHCSLVDRVGLSPLIHLYRVLKLEPCALGAVSGRRACSDPRWCRCDPGIHSQLCDMPAMPLSTWQCQCDPAVPAKHKAGAKVKIRREHKNSTSKPLTWKIQIM